MIRITFLTAFPSAIGIFLLSKEIMQFLFAQRVIEIHCTYIPLSILGLGLIFICINAPMFSALQSINKQNSTITIMLTGGIVMLILNVVLMSIPSINIVEAACATVISEAAISIMAYRIVKKNINLNIKLSEIIIKPMFAAVLRGVTAKINYNMLTVLALNSLNQIFVLLLAIGSGGIIYIISLWLLSILLKNLIIAFFSKKLRKTY